MDFSAPTRPREARNPGNSTRRAVRIRLRHPPPSLEVERFSREVRKPRACNGYAHAPSAPESAHTSAAGLPQWTQRYPAPGKPGGSSGLSSGRIVVPGQNLKPDVLMMEPAEDWYRCDAADLLGTAKSGACGECKPDRTRHRGRESDDRALRPKERHQSPDLQSTRRSDCSSR
jgi:hypothetical protein